MDKEMGPFVSGCVIDTNILIYHLAGVLTDQAEASLADATARHAKVPLMTRNMTDFEQVPELKMVDPFSQITNQ
jgi:hypothetical protein